ncbi:Rossmann-fold NAD(P)-binding domain-containing protein [Streptomyces sviceus]|uniref:hypothetical protein n=1 Tax=Streptomyces sviceus TaxID=285530 RepID=UPI0036E0EA5F
MADHDLVLVTGADGMGRLVTERLRAQNVPVRTDPPRGRPRGRGAGMGAEVVTGDTSNVTTIAVAGSEPGSAIDEHSMTVTDRRKD